MNFRKRPSYSSKLIFISLGPLNLFLIKFFIQTTIKHKNVKTNPLQRQEDFCLGTEVCKIFTNDEQFPQSN